MTTATIDLAIESVFVLGCGVNREAISQLGSRTDVQTLYAARGRLARIVGEEWMPILMAKSQATKYIGTPDFEKYIGLARSVVQVLESEGKRLDETNIALLGSIELARDYCIQKRKS